MTCDQKHPADVGGTRGHDLCNTTVRVRTATVRHPPRTGTRMIRTHHLAALVLAATACTALPATAAESFDSCDGRFIDSLPAHISTPGVWCLRHDVSTAIGAGAAINIAANNVTLDCNGFRIGGLAAGPGSMASGVYVSGRQNASVRNCGIRGFY